MSNSVQRWLGFAAVAFVLASFTALRTGANDTLSWDADQNRVSADIKSENLTGLLEQIATASHWQVYLEPGTRQDVSAKFKNLPPGEALHLLLGNLNFALVPETNARPRLYVFRTSQRNATQRIPPVAAKASRAHAKAIPNELVVRLKPGTKIEDLARLLGARITGRIDALNTYRLEFADEAAAQAARESLLDNPEVIGVDSNYTLDGPPPPQPLASGSGPDWNLTPKTNSGPCQIIVGLIDTSVSSLGQGLDSFVLPSLSVNGGPQTPPNELTHGTAMIQTILQSVQASTGGKTSAKILPVNVYGANTSTTTFDVGQGIYQAVNAGANIINLSLGGSGDSVFLRGLIASASQQGVIFFGAAGNEPVTTPTYPAAYPDVIAVTASDPNGQLAPYANRGSFVSIMEPGTSLVSFQGQPYLVTGTSSATALASGYAAGLADSTRACPDQVVPTIRSKLGVKFNPAP